jgi:hypothetical protein
VLLSNSAIPVWHLGRRSLPLLFMASAIGTAGALLCLTATDDPERRAAGRFALAGQLGELAATYALHREVDRASPRAALPLTRGRSGRLLTAATALTAASVLLALVPGRRWRPRRWTASLLGAAGSLALRWGIHDAGKASARDPQAAIESGARIAAPVLSSPQEQVIAGT